MAIQFKQRCVRCKKNMILMTSRNQFPICYECDKKELEGEIKDPEMKKMFDIPEVFYKNNTFLRNIKKNYLRFGKLSEKQIEVFKKVVKDMENKI